MKVRDVIQISEGYTTAVEMSRELERKIDHTPSLTQDEMLQVRGHPLCIALSFTFKQKFTMPPPPPLPLSPSLFLSQLVSITGSSLPRSQQQALARRKLKQTLKATEKERKILACIPQYSVRGVLILCPVMEVS